MTKTLAQKVRESYGDTVEEFAQRMGTAPATVEGWEAGQEPQEPAKALLEYANKYALARFPRVSEEFAALSIREQLTELMDGFGDHQKSFAKRIGICENSITRWMRQNIISPIAQRYIYEVAVYPKRFQFHPKSFKK